MMEGCDFNLDENFERLRHQICHPTGGSSRRLAALPGPIRHLKMYNFTAPGCAGSAMPRLGRYETVKVNHGETREGRVDLPKFPISGSNLRPRRDKAERGPENSENGGNLMETLGLLGTV
jgi:hypothetical protein